MCLNELCIAQKGDMRNNSVFKIIDLIRSNGRFARPCSYRLAILKCQTFQGDKKWQRVMI
jgi:hypothetical protein